MTMNLGFRCSVFTPFRPLASCSMVKALLGYLSTIQPWSIFWQRITIPKQFVFWWSSCLTAQFFILIMSYNERNKCNLVGIIEIIKFSKISETSMHSNHSNFPLIQPSVVKLIQLAQFDKTNHQW